MAKHLIAHDGRRVRFPSTQRQHIAYFHPEVLGDETKIGLTLSEPELVARGATEDTEVCYRFFSETPVTAKYLAVVVKLLNGEGLIVTAHSTDRAKRNEIVWRRTS